MDLEALRKESKKKFEEAKNQAKCEVEKRKAFFDYLDTEQKIMLEWFAYKQKKNKAKNF